MPSMLAVPETISSSQARPRAMDLISNRTPLRLHWSRARSCGRGWKQDLLEPLGWRLCPGDQQRGVFFERGRWIRGLACALLTGVHQPKRQMAVADLDAGDHCPDVWLICRVCLRCGRVASG